MTIRAWPFLLSLAVAAAARGQSGIADSTSVVEARVVAAAVDVAPGADFPVAIVLKIKSGWHIWTNARDLPATVAQFDGAVHTAITAPSIPVGLRLAYSDRTAALATSPADAVAPVLAQWPDFHLAKPDFGEGPQSYAVFEGETAIFVPMSVASNASAGTVRLTLRIELQACDATSCVAPATIDLPVEIKITPGAQSSMPPAIFATFDPAIFAAIHSGTRPSQAVAFDFFDFHFSIDPNGSGFVLLLAIAALGGLLLNFTPCVLPVIPLKIMGLSRSAGNRRRCLVLGTALSLGVIVFWIALGLAVALISGFTSSSQLFQYPLFTVSIGVIIALMAAGMCGFFTIPLPQSVAGIDFRHDSIGGSLGFGVMTAVLSTPCTAPLMGAAAAWAATQTPLIVLIVFGAIGVGMALPYFILSAFPQLVRHVPKSGPASDLVKQAMGLLLLAAAAYFIGAGISGWLVVPPDPPSSKYWWIVSALGTIAGLWLSLRTLAVTKRFKFRAAFCTLGAVIACISALIGLRLTDEGEIDWIYYTPERLAAALAADEAVLLDFTAEWCLNCKTLEKTVLESAAVLERIESLGIRPIKVDLTGNNEAGRALLKSYDRVTIPLLVILAPDGGPNGREVLKSDAYTPGEVVAALDKAAAQAQPAP